MDNDLRMAFMGSIKKWAKLKTKPALYYQHEEIDNCSMCDYIDYKELMCDKDCSLDKNGQCCDNLYNDYYYDRTLENATKVWKFIINKYLEMRKES